MLPTPNTSVTYVTCEMTMIMMMMMPHRSYLLSLDGMRYHQWPTCTASLRRSTRWRQTSKRTDRQTEGHCHRVKPPAVRPEEL